MEGLDYILDAATNPTSGILHGAVFIAIDRSGKTIYKRASGFSTVKVDSTNGEPLQLDSLYWIASMTKLVTAIAAVQLVERGVLDLESDVRDNIAELRGVKVLKKMRDGQTVYEEVQGKITLRQLLTHTSGLVYDGAPLLQAWSRSRGRTAHTFCGSMEGYTHPLLFQPGKSWGYGAGLDWAGVLIERIGTTSTSFQHPDEHPSTNTPPLQQMAYRVRDPITTDNTRKMSEAEIKPTLKQAPIILKYPLKHDLGGIGLFSTPSDFTSILSSLLRGGDELCKNGKESIDLLFTPQLALSEKKALPAGLGRSMRRFLGVDAESGGAKREADHALAGAVNVNDIPGRRRAGSVCWSGLPNLHWWIDRQTGIAGALFTQLMPPGDAPATSLLIEIETTLYRAIEPGPDFGTIKGGLKL